MAAAKSRISSALASRPRLETEALPRESAASPLPPLRKNARAGYRPYPEGFRPPGPGDPPQRTRIALELLALDGAQPASFRNLQQLVQTLPRSGPLEADAAVKPARIIVAQSSGGASQQTGARPPPTHPWPPDGIGPFSRHSKKGRVRRCLAPAQRCRGACCAPHRSRQPTNTAGPQTLEIAVTPLAQRARKVRSTGGYER